MDVKNLKLWIRLESLLFGIIPGQVASSHRLQLKYLKRIIPYIQKKCTSVELCSYISFKQWIHIACDKLDFPLSVAKYYFHSFLILCRSLQIGKSLLVPCLPSHECSINELDNICFFVYEFVIFLYIQQFSNFKSKFLSQTVSSPIQEWPSMESLDQSQQIELPSLKNGFDEDRFCEFILQGLQDIFELFAGKESAYCKEESIKLEWVQALNLIIAGSFDGEKKIRPLEVICTEDRLKDITGYIKERNCFHKRKLLNFLKSYIGCSPFNLQSTLKFGKVLSWLKLDKVLKSGSGHAITNTPFSPTECKLVLLAFIFKYTLARMSNTLHYANVYIHRCYSSYLYLLDPLRNLTIEKCKDVTVATGPVNGTVYISGCKNVKLLVVCARLIVSDCRDCILNVATQIQPLLVGSKNINIVMGPYCTFYPMLEEHIRDCHLDIQGGLFEKPLVMDDRGELINQNDTYSVITPDKFSYFAIPFKMSGKTNKIPFLPSSYTKAFKQQRASLKDWQDDVKNKLNPQQKKEIEKIVRLRMKLWMRETTFQRELDQLSGKSKMDASAPSVITGTVIDIPS